MTISKDAIEQRRAAEVSSMPAGLLDTFTVEDILDLTAFLQSRGGAQEMNTITANQHAMQFVIAIL